MKKFAKKIVVALLGNQVTRLVRKNQPKVIAVAGSVGKTSTKLAVVQYLRQHFKVQTQEGNYNDIVTVPLVFFGHNNPPNITNPLAWLKILLANEKQLRKPYPYDIVVLELGTDGPGQLVEFNRFLEPDIAVVTAVAPEHMEFFGSLDNVAMEELSIATFSKKVVINKDLCGEYASQVDGHMSYGLENGDFCLSDLSRKGLEYSFGLSYDGDILSKVTYTSASDVLLYGVLAAVGVGELLDFPREKIATAVQSIGPAAGRMRVLLGIQGSTILDDTYNASPDAVLSSLDALYAYEAPQRIALLGNMNELGDYAEKAHTDVGDYCDPIKLDLVITLGKEADAFTAPAAAAKGCRVEKASSPYHAAEIIQKNLKQGAVILAKGSQNGVFAEETVKQLLANPDDASQLVRQSAAWLSKKAKQFPEGAAV